MVNLFGSFTPEALEQFRHEYAERILELPSGKYEVKHGKNGTFLVPAGIEPKAGAELPPGTKGKNVSGKRMTASGQAGRIKGAQAALNSASTPGAKAAAQTNLNAARIG
jgi:hypothetical protein